MVVLGGGVLGTSVSSPAASFPDSAWERRQILMESSQGCCIEIITNVFCCFKWSTINCHHIINGDWWWQIIIINGLHHLMVIVLQKPWPYPSCKTPLPSLATSDEPRRQAPSEFPCRASKGLRSYEAWTQGRHRETSHHQVTGRAVLSFTLLIAKKRNVYVHPCSLQIMNMWHWFATKTRVTKLHQISPAILRCHRPFDHPPRVSKMCLLGSGHGRPRLHASLWVHPTTMK